MNPTNPKLGQQNMVSQKVARSNSVSNICQPFSSPSRNRRPRRSWNLEDHQKSKVYRLTRDCEDKSRRLDNLQKLLQEVTATRRDLENEIILKVDEAYAAHARELLNFDKLQKEIRTRQRIENEMDLQIKNAKTELLRFREQYQLEIAHRETLENDVLEMKSLYQEATEVKADLKTFLGIDTDQGSDPARESHSGEKSLVELVNAYGRNQAKVERAKQRSEKQLLQNQLSGAVSMNKDLQKQHTELRASLVKMSLDKNEAVIALAKATTHDAHKVDDESITRSVKALGYAISNWVNSQSFVLVTWTSRFRQKVEFDFLCETSSGYREYLNNPADVALIVRAYIWKFLVERLFGKAPISPTNDVGHRVSLAYNSLLKQFLVDREENEDFHEWRAKSARLLEGHSCYTSYKQEVSAELATVLFQVLSPISKQDIEQSELEQIIKNAMDLDLSLSKQRASFRFESIDPPEYFKLQYDEEYMEGFSSKKIHDLKLPHGQDLVMLMLVPALYKYGTAEGKDYDRSRIITKAEVVIGNVQKE